MNPINLRLRQVVFESPPALHFRNGKEQTGGFSGPFFDFIEQVLRNELQQEISTVRVLETGAGLSTLFFLSLGCQTTSFSLPDVIERLSDFFNQEEFATLRVNWFPHPGRSELLLGSHAGIFSDSYTCCLIDGSHSVHAVFTDFMYCHETLSKGGVLFVDDTHFPGPNLLAQMIDQLDCYKSCGQFKKLRAFKKTTGRKTFDNMLDFNFQFPERDLSK